ncbi:MAG TPA: RidA family protein [Erysipelotrichaceae bacterium]|nr:RidA family protein [Erysipelotrichaceae bacterium]HQB32032.1 RidA family protein [Erysipelotrichaceae bacterium]
MKVVSTKKAPAAIGPYSQGYIAGNLIYTSGQLGIDPKTGQYEDCIRWQTERSCQNVKAILEEAGTGLDKVIKTTCFLADMKDFAVFNEVYARYFTSKPARSTVAVKTLPKNMLCEIEAIAVI